MIIFRKAKKPAQALNDLDAYIGGLGYEPIKLLDREITSWGEISYAELTQIIEAGRYEDFIDWRERYSKVVNEILSPLWLKAIEEASRRATRGKIVLYDSHDEVREWLRSHGGELISRISEQSRRAVINVIEAGIFNRTLPKVIAQQVRPLIGLTAAQVQQNLNYRAKVYQQYLSNGASETTAQARADKAAIKYAAKQHRFRAETIVHTETAFAYNKGADMGVRRAISAQLMGRCEMVWTTAGVLKTCSRCLELKDKVVGTTDEVGVQLPPLHPRCRCAIIYRETTRGLAAGNIDITSLEGREPKLIEQIKFEPVTIQKTLEKYEAQIVKSPVEHALIIAESGEVYHMNGDVHGISLRYFEQLKDKLIGAHATHNHPRGAFENEHTFSDDDFIRFQQFKMARLRGIDEKFLYELNRNPLENEFVGRDLNALSGLATEDYHYAVMLKALIEGLGYWRRKR